jgi:membrane fusion protein (multidrug efflux system)
MDEKWAGFATEQEVAQLRDEVRRLREEQEKTKQQPKDGSKNGQNGGGEEKDQKEDKKQGSDQDEDKKGKGEGEDEEKGEDKKDEKPHPLRKILIIAGVALLLIVGLLWWLHARQFEDTDDAIVDAHTSGLAARISGTVVAVYQEEGQQVQAGQVVVDLDPRDYQMALEQARAQLSQAQKQALAEEPNVPVTVSSNRADINVAQSEVSRAEQGVAAAERNYQSALAKVAESEANNAKAQADVGRYQPLAASDEVPQEQFAQVVANAKALAATVDANRRSAEAAQKQVEQAREQFAQARQRAAETSSNAPRQVAIRRANVASRQAALAAAQAQLDQAVLNLSYCKMVTPVNGIIAKRIAEVGQHVAPGQQVLLVSQVDDLWVTANFRETQLKLMHPGQSVRIHVDALGQDFDGFVENMPAASGSVTSLLPPENATGNFVKIVQRLPVRIRLKQGQGGLDRLRPGMSVEPKVRVR